MRKSVISMTIALILALSSCATHKKMLPTSAKTSDKNYDFYIKEGNSFLKQGDYEQAVETLKRAIAINPNSSKAHNLLGIAYFRRKDYKLAKEQYEKSLQISPAYAQACSNLGSTHLMLRDFKEAEKMFKKALSLDPNLISPYFSLGTLYIEQGKIEEGIIYFSKGVELDPEFLEKNAAFVTNFSSQSFNNPEIYYVCAKLFASAGNIEKTVEYLKKAETAGFKDWNRIGKDKEFDKIKNDERIKSFIHS